MKRLLTVGLVLLVAVSIAGGPAWAAKVKHPSKLKYPKLELTTPEYDELTFENGMTGFLIEDHEVPVVNMTMILGTGRPAMDKVGLGGLAAWTIRNGGSENWPGDRINEELEFVDAYVEVGGPAGGGGMMGRGGGGGDGRSTSVSVNCLKKDLPLCLEIMAELLVNPAFPEEKIELRRETMLENIRRENDEPRGIAGREFGKILYGDHPMAWQVTEKTANAILRDDLVAYHQAFFHPNNAIIGISGDVTKDEIMGLLDEALAGWEQADVVIEPEPELPLTFVPSVNYVRKNIDQGVIMIGHLGLNSRDESRPAVQIVNFVLGGGSFTSRITQKVRTDEGLAYAAYSRYSHDPWTYGTFVASSQTRSDATARAASLISDLIAEMQADGPSEEEFENARDAYLNKQVFEYDSKAAVVQRLVQLKWQGRPLDTSERDIEAIENLTLDDVKAAAAEYLHPDGLVMLFVGDQEQFEQPLSNFGEVNTIELPE
ncbi:MAG: pitrilysin family protein [Candidatus Eisenbacteria bacterium]